MRAMGGRRHAPSPPFAEDAAVGRNASTKFPWAKQKRRAPNAPFLMVGRCAPQAALPAAILWVVEV
jgi:hypothetical protein